VKVLEWCYNQKELDEREVYWIDFYQAVESDTFYNLAKGGDGCKKGSKLSEEAKKHISEAHQDPKHNMYGKHHTADAKLKMSKARKGKRLSEEHKLHLSFALKKRNIKPWLGKHHTEETKQKLSKVLKGRTFTEEHKKNISKNHADVSGSKNPMYGVHLKGELSHMYGKHHSEETKRKLSKTLSDGRKAGKNHPLYGKKWINNGIENKVVYESELNKYLSCGWRKGQIHYKCLKVR